ncbi:MAG: glutathione S-transferase family protein [Bauldia sp.]
MNANPGAFHIIIGYRTVSSWSLRGWLPLKKVGVPFEETLLRYRVPAEKAKLVALSPTGKVPLLVHRRGGTEIKVWDSLAIAEYLAELFPRARLWPEDPVARAHARSISAEMHSGFRPLRDHLPMALLDRRPGEGLRGEGVAADLARIEAMWTHCRETWGKKSGGPYLFGHYTIADAVYAPIATRFRTYMPHLMPICMAYAEAVLSDPDFLVWEEKAANDPPPEPQS